MSFCFWHSMACKERWMCGPEEWLISIKSLFVVIKANIIITIIISWEFCNENTRTRAIALNLLRYFWLASFYHLRNKSRIGRSLTAPNLWSETFLLFLFVDAPNVSPFRNSIIHMCATDSRIKLKFQSDNIVLNEEKVDDKLLRNKRRLVKKIKLFFAIWFSRFFARIVNARANVLAPDDARVSWLD